MNSWVYLFALFVASATAQRRPPSGGPDRDAQILSYVNENPGDGTYRWSYETSNGIAAQEQGSQRAVPDETGKVEEGTVNQGSFTYTSPEGEVISITYVSDENGFQPQGAHLPTPPPIPEAIQRALATIGRLNKRRAAKAARAAARAAAAKRA